MDTHINAFFADVEEKKKAVVIAQGELQAAEERLALKKQQVGWEEPEQEPKGQEEKAKPVEEKKTTSVFGRK